MTAGLFVTGTDTGCGKTLVTLGLLRALALTGQRVAGMKPVAAGAESTPTGLRNDDALAIQSLCDPAADYETVNPICFAPAIAPHIAAAEARRPVTLAPIVAARDALAADHDVIVVEGAGGWRVPLADGLDMGGLALHLGFPVVLVVAMRLGCLNHALLTQEAIHATGLPLIGWVANTVQLGMERMPENLQTLHSRLEAPCLGELPHLPAIDIDRVAARLRLAGSIAGLGRKRTQG